MFDRPWFILLIAIAGIGALLQMPAVFVLPTFLFMLMAAGRWWQQRVLNRVTYSRKLTFTHVFPGESVDLTLEAHNDKRLPVPWLVVHDTLPAQLTAAEASPADAPPAPPGTSLTHSFVLRGGARARSHVRLAATERGYYPIGPARLHSGDPFSLVDATREAATRDWLVVYPQIIPLAELGIPAKDLFGEKRAQRRMFEDPSRTRGVREYQPGDSFRHIHWKATARQGSLHTRVYEQTVNTSIMACLNVATFPHAWQGVRQDRLERAISLSASIANEGADRGFAVGVAINCSAPLTTRVINVPPSRSADQLMHVLEALAAATHYVVTPFESFLLHESPRLAWGATIVAVTPLISEAILAAMSQLREAGRRLVLISVDPQPLPPLKDVICYHLPLPGEAEPAHG